MAHKIVYNNSKSLGKENCLYMQAKVSQGHVIYNQTILSATCFGVFCTVSITQKTIHMNTTYIL